MTPSEYSEFYDRSVQDYAAEGARSGGWTPAEAPAKALAQFRSLLPQGQDTPDHLFFTVIDDAGQSVGHLWIAVRGEGERRSVFIYNLAIAEGFQGRGYGESTMHLLRAKARELSAHSIGLHVFGHNERAIRLYQKLGYKATNIQMRLDLP